jgi:COP9 signalosome complex subunit 1
MFLTDLLFQFQESIRRGHDDLGDHFLDCGDLANALKCYSRARDYCTSGRHVVNMCVNVIKVSVYLQVRKQFDKVTRT